MIPRENGKINLWILTNEPEDSKYLIHRYIYDPEEEKILNSFQNKLNNYPPNIKLFYIDKEVLEVNGGATGIEPSIVTYNQENGNVIMWWDWTEITLLDSVSKLIDYFIEKYL